MEEAHRRHKLWAIRSLNVPRPLGGGCHSQCPQCISAPQQFQRTATRVDGTQFSKARRVLLSFVSDAAGQSVGRVQYDPYGEVITSTLPVTLTERLFTGQRLDSSTGLYYYNARYYDPHLGRFIQPDSLVPDPLNPQAWNRFSYVYNNPTSYVDPGGHIPIDWLFDVGGLAFDIYQLHQDPSLANWGWLALDVGLWVLPFVPAAAGALAHADEAADLARMAGRVEDVGDARRTAYLLGGGGIADEATEQVLELSRKYRNVEVVDIDPEMVRGLEIGLQSRGGIPSNVRIRAMAAAELGSLPNADIFVVSPDPGWLRTTLATDLNIVVGRGSRAYVVSELGYLENVLTTPGLKFGRLPRIENYPGTFGPSSVFRIEDIGSPAGVKIYSSYFGRGSYAYFAYWAR